MERSQQKHQQHRVVHAPSKHLRQLVLRHLVVVILTVQPVTHARTCAPGTPGALPRVGPRDIELVQLQHGVVRQGRLAQLFALGMRFLHNAHLPAVDHIPHVGDGDGRLGDVGGDDALPHALR